MIIREENNVLDTDKAKFYERQLKFYVKNTLDYLKIGWKEYEPDDLTFYVDDQGYVYFAAYYKEYGNLTYNRRFLIFKANTDAFYGEEIKELGTWLFNLNIEGASSMLSSLQLSVTNLNLSNIPNLIDYTNTEIKFSGTITK